MREIIFRGKRTDNGEWVKGNLEHDRDLGTTYIFGFTYYADAAGLQRESFSAQVLLETVGQYTGVRDKSGKKIFEGDIITRKWPAGVGMYYVKYDTECMSFVGQMVDPHRFTTLDRGGFEVIGNIYDNKNLLEGGIYCGI